MDFANYLKNSRKELGLTQIELAELIGTNVSSVRKWETRVQDPSLSSLQRLTTAGISFDRFALGQETGWDSDSISLLQKMSDLDEYGVTAVVSLLRLELKRVQQQKHLNRKDSAARHIPCYRLNSGADVNQQAPMELMKLPPEAPAEAEIAFQIEDNIMTPVIAPGEIIYVKYDTLSSGDIGVFQVGTKLVCRFYYEDNKHITLVPANIKHHEQTIRIAKTDNIRVFGKKINVCKKTKLTKI